MPNLCDPSHIIMFSKNDLSQDSCHQCSVGDDIFIKALLTNKLGMFDSVVRTSNKNKMGDDPSKCSSIEGNNNTCVDARHTCAIK